MLVESINQIQITRWAKYRLSVKHVNQLYIYWDLMAECGVGVLLNVFYEYLKYGYGSPR